MADIGAKHARKTISLSMSQRSMKGASRFTIMRKKKGQGDVTETDDLADSADTRFGLDDSLEMS